ncbi:hypothetical protein ACOSQ4_027556 [Xanthoceras sorbifolium]
MPSTMPNKEGKREKLIQQSVRRRRKDRCRPRQEHSLSALTHSWVLIQRKFRFFMRMRFAGSRWVLRVFGVVKDSRKRYTPLRNACWRWSPKGSATLD